MAFQVEEEVHRKSPKHLIELHRQIQSIEFLRREIGIDMDLTPTRGWAASPDFLLLIARYAREARPDTVVECGSGTSTVVLARCLQMNGRGHVFPLEHDARFAELTRRDLARQGLSAWATVIDAPLQAHIIESKAWDWYSLDHLPDRLIDMLIVDGPPRAVGSLARYPAGPCLFPQLGASGTVFVDDAARADERQCIDKWLKAFPKLRRTEHNCEKGCVSLCRPSNPLWDSGESELNLGPFPQVMPSSGEILVKIEPAKPHQDALLP